MKRRKRGSGRDGTDRRERVEGPAPFGGPVRHIPVLLREVLAALEPKDGERYIDATFGAGGYSRAILEAANCTVLALDRDPAAIEAGASMLAVHGDRLILRQTPFSEMESVASSAGWSSVDGVVFDLGVSSMQLDEAGRGFSFMRDGPLDMRMSRDGLSAADVVNTFPQEEIADILYKYGEERRSRSIAAAVVKDRVAAPFTTTAQLAGLIERILGRRHDDPKHPATRSFQALRLFVNDELGELERGLAAAERLLGPGGRLVAVSFHSLEDRIVKTFLSERSGKRPAISRYQPADLAQTVEQTFRLNHRHGVTPGDDEVADNPRARSARLRDAIRVR